MDCLNKNTEPELGLKLSKEGKEWIKLLTIKHWMKKYENGKIERYPVPQNLNNFKEIINAIKILSSKDNSNIIKNILKETKKNIIIENIKNEERFQERIKIWAKTFLHGKIQDKFIIPFPEISPEFLIRTCKNILKNKEDCIRFLKMLIENNLIDSKQIYQTLVDKIYK